MLNSPNRSRSSPRSVPSGALRMGIAAALLGLALLNPTAGLSQSGGQNPCPSQPCPNASLEAMKHPVLDTLGEMQLQQEQSPRNNNFEALNAERKKLISDDVAMLLELATELDAEANKTGDGELSFQFLRKAESVEKLARDVQEKMKLTIGAS